MMRRLGSLLVRVAISAALLVYALSGIDTGILRDRLRDIDIPWLSAAIALAFIQLALMAIRWRQITLACGARMELGRALRISLIAAFFNQVLPSTVGGDATRIWLLARDGSGWSKAAHSVLLDRFVGVLALAILVVLCLPWSMVLIHHPVGRAVLLTIGAGSIAGAVLFIAAGYLRWIWLQRWMPLRHLMQMAVIARQFLFSAATGGPIMAISLAIHVITAGIAWCAARAIGAPFEFFYALLLVPPVMLITIVPISLAGWGVREKSLVLAFAYAGLSEGNGFLISVLLGATMLVVGMAGGIVWLAGSDRAAAEDGALQSETR